MTTDLSALIARLEAAEVGSRELGRDILVAMNIVREVDPTLFYGVGNEDTWHFGDAAEQDGFWRILPDPSTSLDAALALAERVSPEVFWEMSCRAIINGQKQYGVTLWPEDLEAGVEGAHGHAPNPALALVIAILRAKQGEV